MTDAIGSYEALFALTPEQRVSAFRHMNRLYPTRTIRRGGHVAALPAGDPLDVRYRADGQLLDSDGFMQRTRCAGLLVIERGRVVLERYAFGNTAQAQWISFSMAKSVSSTLVGAALRDGFVGSLDEPVTRTVPLLRGSAYDGVSIRHVLQMSSGVQWNEAYLDPDSDRRKMLAVQARQEPGAVIEFMRRLPRAAEPGTRFNYNTAETYLLGAILTSAIGRPLSDYLSEKIWGPAGMESGAYWQLESPAGQEFAGSGISATLRDYGRFGLFVLGHGVVDGNPVLADGWMAEATSVRPDSRLAPGRLAGFEPLGYGYQWWTFPPASAGTGRLFGALGIFGQQVYVDTQAELVIVLNSAWPEPTHLASRLESYTFFGAVTEALRTR